MPWLILRWILEDRFRPVAAMTVERTETRIGGLRIAAGAVPLEATPEETPPPRVTLKRLP
jgi:hypothetical protein